MKLKIKEAGTVSIYVMMMSGLQKSMSSFGYPNHGIQITDISENTKYTQFDLKTDLCYTRR
jgi:hypothetical protein